VVATGSEVADVSAAWEEGVGSAPSAAVPPSRVRPGSVVATCRIGGGWCQGGLGGEVGGSPFAAVPPSRLSVSYLGTPRMILHQLAQVGCVGRRRSTNLRHLTRRSAAIPVCETDRSPAPSTGSLRPVPPAKVSRNPPVDADGQSRTDRNGPPASEAALTVTIHSGKGRTGPDPHHGRRESGERRLAAPLLPGRPGLSHLRPLSHPRPRSGRAGPLQSNRMAGPLRFPA
jgi:hypothetical protein